MSKITAIIVDDEKQARHGLQVLLERDSDVELIATCKDGMQAIQQIQDKQPDLLFLDIQMPGINGFEVLNSVPHQLIPPVIFTTAYDQYALQAFEVHALDYLLKPFTDARFYRALQFAKEQIRSRTSQAVHERLLDLLKHYEARAGNEPPHLVHESSTRAAARERLVVRTSGKICFIPLATILYIEACDYFVKIKTDKSEHMVRESLKALAGRLPRERFARIHRSHIVNLEAITEIQPYQNGDFHVMLRNGKELRGSRKYRGVVSGRW